MSGENKCRRCLLYEAGESAALKGVGAYLETLDDDLKADESTYARRLELCLKCDYLISGMCLKCGCYCELRAALKRARCADADNTKWFESN